MFESVGNISQSACRWAGIGVVAGMLLVAACVNNDAGSDPGPDAPAQPTVARSTVAAGTATVPSIDPPSTPFFRPTSVSSPPPTAVPDAVTLAVERAIADYGVSASAVELLAYEEQSWSSTALGCPERGKSYAQIVTSGFEVTLSILGARVVYHVDDAGTTIVECEGVR